VVLPIGLPKGWGNPPRRWGRLSKPQPSGWTLDQIRYQFFSAFVERHGWVRLPHNWGKYVPQPGRLTKEIIRPLGRVIFFDLKGGSIDLITADNSPKNSPPTRRVAEKSADLRSLIWEYLTLKGSGSRDKLQRLREIEENHPKFAKVYNRLRRLPVCSTTGHLGLKGTPGDFDLSYHPHRCHSLICPVCGYYESRRKFSRIFDLLKLSVDLEHKKLSFTTLTAKSFKTPTEAVEHMFKYRQRIYNLSISPRLLKKLKGLIVREILAFYHNLKGKYGVRYARNRVKKEIEFIRSFIKTIQKRYEEVRKTKNKVRIADLINLIWKYEAHKTAYGWHGHWHIISDTDIPKTLLNAFWKYITDGRGEITHIQRLKGRKAIAEISKYETKPVNEKLSGISTLWNRGYVIQSNGVIVWLDELFEFELALYGRQKITVWGNWKRVSNDEGTEEEEKTKVLWCVDVSTKTPMFHISKAIRKARKLGKELSISACEITFSERVEPHPDAQRVFKGEIYINSSGDLKIKVNFQSEDERLWFSELLERSLEICGYLPINGDKNSDKPPDLSFYEEMNSDGLIRSKISNDMSFLEELDL